MVAPPGVPRGRSALSGSQMPVGPRCVLWGPQPSCSFLQVGTLPPTNGVHVPWEGLRLKTTADDLAAAQLSGERLTSVAKK